MIIELVRLALRKRGWVLVIAVLFLAAGIYSALRLPMDALPDITSLQMEVNTHVEALAPEEVEKQITIPLERELIGVRGVTQMRSTSKAGLSQITLFFDGEPDVYHLRQAIMERIQGAVDLLPPGVQPTVPQVTSGLGEIYYYQVRYRAGAKEKPANEMEELTRLKLIQDYTVAPRMLEVPGVSEVSTSGGYVNQVVVEPDPAKLAGMGLAIDDIANVVRQNVSNSGGGIVQQAGQQVLVRTNGRVQTAEDIGNLSLRYGAGTRPIVIREVATVKNGPAPRYGAALVDGEEAVVGAVLLSRGENTRAVAQRVGEKLVEIQSQLPQGVELAPLYNRGELISRTVGTIEHNLIGGALLVSLVLFVFLRNWRGALIVALAIPLSLLFALTGMVEFQITGNLISLGAIDFGLIVDGSVVMVENILRHLVLRQQQLGRALNAGEQQHCIEEACIEVAPPMVAGIGIITLVYAPIFALTGIEGKMFQPLAATVTMALIGALLLALTVVPALSSFLLEGRMHEQNPAWFQKLKTGYGQLLGACLPYPGRLVGISVGLFLVAAVVFYHLGAEFIPHLDEGTTLLAIRRADSIGLGAALGFQATTEKLILNKFPQVRTVFSRVGADDKSVDPVGANQSDTYVLYGPNGVAPLSKDDFIKQMSEALKTAIPGQSGDFVQPIEDRFNDFFLGSRADIAVKIYGDDFNILEQTGAKVKNLLGQIQGSADINFNAFQKVPVEEVKPDRAALSRYGLQADDINHALAEGVAGKKLGTILTGDHSIDVMLRYPPELRAQAGQLNRFYIRLADGGLISLDKVARVEYANEVAEVQRERSRRMAVVTANVRGRDVASFVTELQDRVARTVQVPSGYTIDYAGQFKNLASASQRLRLIVPIVLLVIFGLIYFAFRDWRQVVLIYTGIPLAVTGGVFTLWLRQLPFSIPAAIGFIALSGVAVLNGIVLISYFNKLRQLGKSTLDTVIEGSVTRLRPVLMTATVASVGLVPMALATGPGAEIQRPLATVIIGGILSSTFLTLLLLPALYARLGRRIKTMDSRSQRIE